MPSNSSEYSKKYYQKNREKLAQARRKKYLTDPAFAERQRARSKQSMRRRREAMKEANKRDGIVSNRKSGPRLYEVIINGEPQEVRMYHIGALAQLLGRRVKTLYMWEKTGILPKAMFRDSAKRRMYTEDQVTALVEGFHKVMAEALGHKWLDLLSIVFREIWDSMPQGVKDEG